MSHLFPRLSIAVLLPLLATGAHADSRMAPMPVKNATYAAECGACHFAYPPQFLPAQSWQKIMSGLDQHFGENAELSPELVQSLTTYLTENAADRGASGNRLANPPLRITELSGFRREHDELPARMVTGNPQVGSFSNCNACHSRAEEGSFREREIRIPGYGRWED